MGGAVAWHVELTVKPGQLENFRALTVEMVEFTRREDGVLSYQRFIEAGSDVVHAYERYADSAAALAHLKNFAARFSARFGTMVERRRFTVFGDASDDLRAFLAPLGAVFARSLGDLPYW